MVQPGGHGLLTVRALFLSDVHLGSRRTRIEPLLQFLRQLLHPEHLYLAGDFIDGWCFARRWHWTDTHDEVIERLTRFAESGTRIHYAPGNHDEFLRRSSCWSWLRHSALAVKDEFVHTCADGRKFLVLHGDQFDRQTQMSRWCHRLGSAAYAPLLATDQWINRCLAPWAGRQIPWTMMVKQKIARVGRFVREFEQHATTHAANRGLHGVICGHIHVPNMCSRDNTIYVNLGDWLENCTCLVEHANGRLELMRYDSTPPRLAHQATSLLGATDAPAARPQPNFPGTPGVLLGHATTHFLAPHSTCVQYRLSEDSVLVSHLTN